MQTIDYALSIGPNCRAKYHLRRRFGPLAVSGIFDWQITPPTSCLAYLDADFVGLFERDDLEIRAGALRNKRWGTSHLHELPVLTDAALDEHYARMRSRHDHLCRNFRSTIRSGKRVLLAFSRGIEDDKKQQLVAALEAYAGDTRLHFIFEPQDGAPWQTWTGDQDLWDTLLAPYRLTLSSRMKAAVWRATRTTLEALRRGASDGSPARQMPSPKM